MVSNIWVAAADNQIEVVESHIASGNFSANSKDPNGYTPIHAAASYGHTELLRLLISKGGDINIQDTEGDTPLHHVEDLEIAKVLVEELKADTGIKNADGLTAAQYIEQEDEFPEVVAYLRQQSGDLLENVPEKHALGVVSLPDGLDLPDGQDLRYSYEDVDENLPMDEERRKQLEAIANSDNPEAALRELVTSAVREGLANYRDAEDRDSKRLRP